MKTYINYYSWLGLFIGLFSSNTLFSCVNTRQGMDIDTDAISLPLDVSSQDANLDKTTKTKRKLTALGSAIDRGEADMVRLLIRNNKVDINKAGDPLIHFGLYLSVKSRKYLRFYWMSLYRVNKR